MNTLKAISRNLVPTVLLWFCPVAFLPLLHSCIYEDISNPVLPEGGVHTLTLQFSVPPVSQKESNTRVVEDEVRERTVVNLAVWAFDSGGGCIDCRYIASPQTEDQAAAATGAFSLILTDWKDGVESLLVYANCAEISAAGYIGKQKNDIIYDNALLTAPAGTDTPVTPPLPMSFFTGFTQGTKVVTVDLKRSVSRMNVEVRIENPALEGRLQTDRAEVYFEHLLSRSTLANMYDDGITSLSVAKNGAPVFYNTQWIPLTSLPLYACQRTFSGVVAEGGDWGPVELTLRIPYTTTDGTVVEDNYYRTKIVNPAEAGIRKNWLFPNSLYRVTFHIQGFGADGLQRVEIECLPWGVENQDVIAGHRVSTPIGQPGCGDNLSANGETFNLTLVSSEAAEARIRYDVSGDNTVIKAFTFPKPANGSIVLTVSVTTPEQTRYSDNVPVVLELNIGGAWKVERRGMLWPVNLTTRSSTTDMNRKEINMWARKDVRNDAGQLAVFNFNGAKAQCAKYWEVSPSHPQYGKGKWKLPQWYWDANDVCKDFYEAMKKNTSLKNNPFYGEALRQPLETPPYINSNYYWTMAAPNAGTNHLVFKADATLTPVWNVIYNDMQGAETGKFIVLFNDDNNARARCIRDLNQKK